jgi:hypothetical protein
MQCPGCERGETIHDFGFEFQTGGEIKTHVKLVFHEGSNSLCLKGVDPQHVEEFRRVRLLPKAQLMAP